MNEKQREFVRLASEFPLGNFEGFGLLRDIEVAELTGISKSLLRIIKPS